MWQIITKCAACTRQTGFWFCLLHLIFSSYPGSSNLPVISECCSLSAVKLCRQRSTQNTKNKSSEHLHGRRWKFSMTESGPQTNHAPWSMAQQETYIFMNPCRRKGSWELWLLEMEQAGWRVVYLDRKTEILHFEKAKSLSSKTVTHAFTILSWCVNFPKPAALWTDWFVMRVVWQQTCNDC